MTERKDNSAGGLKHLKGEFIRDLGTSKISLQERMASFKKTQLFEFHSKTEFEDGLAQELQEIFQNLESMIDLRTAYMQTSKQTPGDNPKDSLDWEIYPTPPKQNYPSNLDSQGNEINNIVEEFEFTKCFIPQKDDCLFEMTQDGIFHVYETVQDQTNNTAMINVPSVKKYFQDLDYLLSITTDGPTKSFCFRRLRFLESKFQMYILLNEYQEVADSKSVPHRDFYNVRKVDTHIHHSACMNQKHLLRFIKSKLRKFPNDVCLYRDEKYLTLSQVFTSLKLTAYDLSIDTLDMHAHKDSFHRFDKFNLKYNPMGESRLREIFLKTDNYINGTFVII
jgi:AMP deaminase